MLITDEFLLLNLPKTASTFARQVIKKAYGEYNIGWKDKLLFQLGIKEKKVKELWLSNIKVGFRTGKDQHGIYDQIPERFRNSGRELVSIIRNPFSAYVSRYTFESWKRNLPDEIQHVKQKFPHFPDLSFNEYIEYTNSFNLPHRLQGISLKQGTKLGTLSVQFIQMFCKNHKQVLSSIDENYKKNGLFKNHFPDITFLKTENINDDLYQFLLEKGFSKEKIQFIKEEEKVNVSREKPFPEYLNKEAVDKIMELEWLLFDLFPEYKPDKKLTNF